MESPELVKDRILRISDIVGKDKVWVTPDCGLRTRSWEIAYEKLCNLTKGAEMAREVA
jgi:5-methyltetrahydropteroyltriglutamate--homocysteine methyltransferase